MIITVTLNAAIDKTLAVPNFQLGRRHRSTEQRTMAGGKGVNVARALKTLGQPVIATGLAGGPTGTRISEQLTEEAILSDFVRIRDESRTSTAVIDPTSGQQTEINEQGPEATESELALFRDKLLYLAKGADICVFAGSLPRAVDNQLYAELLSDLSTLGVMTVVDAEGEPMELALRAGPDLVTPNAAEAEGLVGHEFRDQQEHAQAVYELCELGAREAIITHPEGCFAIVGRNHERHLYSVTVEPLEPVSAIGAGDVFLAGYLSARYSERPYDESLRFAVACAAESTQHFSAGILDPREVERIASDVSVTELELPAAVDARA
jgi:1-phosphofructokinase/tagatose 6-phosphate kinase